ncbi:eukaryotic translation initiation factor eIF2A [Cooperia oncophora]
MVIVQRKKNVEKDVQNDTWEFLAERPCRIYVKDLFSKVWREDARPVYLLNSNSGESFKVQLPKAGPVHAAKWNPVGKDFCVCYGFMPAVVSIYNLRGDEIFHTDEGPRNDIFYNVFGNILLTCGFGNLGKGKMEFWDVEKMKQIVAIEVPNTTLFEWAPDGQHFLTATTTPRLRIDNGFR